MSGRTATALCFLVLGAAGLMSMGLHAAPLAYKSPFLVKTEALTPRGIDRIVAREVATKDAARLYARLGCTTRYAELTARNALDNGLPVKVLAALIYVESSCKSNAVSYRGATGLTQVMPKIWKIDRKELLDPEANVRNGAQILASYVKRHGLREGLHHYNGTGASMAYADRVLSLARRG